MNSYVHWVRIRRKYRLKHRAERSEATHRRITQAAMELHLTLGPERTTISAIARRAGVQRLTVYRHFPTLKALFQACSGLHRATHPLPEIARWRPIGDPEERLRSALKQIYAHYARTASLWANVLRDAETSPLVKEAAAHRFRYLSEVRDSLAPGWRVRPGARRLLRAALAHAVAFRTWQSLVGAGGISEEEAIDLMVGLVRAAAGQLGRASGAKEPRG